MSVFKKFKNFKKIKAKKKPLTNECEGLYIIKLDIKQHLRLKQ
jgi:hypothetical protein